jgi:hypothetical protein
MTLLPNLDPHETLNSEERELLSIISAPTALRVERTSGAGSDTKLTSLGKAV